jgi:hypothetical protein
MKNAIEAINELIKATNMAQARGTYSLKEAYEIYKAIEFLNTAVAAQQAQEPVNPQIENSEK